jgi:hypothetical protein
MGYIHNEQTMVIHTPVVEQNEDDNNNDNDYIEPLHNSYWLGVPMINILQNGIVELLVDYRITVDEFLNTRRVGWCEIMQITHVHIENTPFVAYYAVVKTFWLREFQRLWKRQRSCRP